MAFIDESLINRALMKDKSIYMQVPLVLSGSLYHTNYSLVLESYRGNSGDFVLFDSARP